MAQHWTWLAIVFLFLSTFQPQLCNAASPLHPRIVEDVKFRGRYDYGNNIKIRPARQVQGTYPITGVLGGTGPNGSVPVRPEIRQLQKNSYAWTLYILGLDMMQAADQQDQLSWYQIAGIHGRPFIPWDGVQATPGNEDNGYCTHVDILFLTWHRPYLALLEQVLYSHIQYIASLYPTGPTRDKYIAAATNFRMPYWDWAAVPPTGESALPNSVGVSPYISVAGPFGTQTIQNPLYSYVFSPLNSTDLPDYPFSVYPQTLRYPTTTDSSASSQDSLVAEILDANSASFRARLYNLFTAYTTYTTFSNEAWISSAPSGGNYDSIESVHDVIHGITGMGGHMTYIEYSAFDPIFFLHHTMIDRCFALWQALHPGSFVEPAPSTIGTFTTSPGQIENGSSPLTPFHDDSIGDFWTSDSSRSTETFGYAYPETANTTGLTAAQLTAKVVAAIQSLYGPNTTATTTSSSKRSPITNKKSLSPRDNTLNDTHTEYLVNILAPKHALNTSYFIYIFLSPYPPSSNPKTWPTDPTLVGTQCIFTRTSIHPSVLDTDPGIKITAAIPLTASLTKHFNSVDTGTAGYGVSVGGEEVSKEEVLAYVRSNLRYRVALVGGEVVENSVLAEQGLNVTVASVEVHGEGREGCLPVWGDVRVEFVVDPGL